MAMQKQGRTDPQETELAVNLPGPEIREATNHAAAPPAPTPYPIDEVEEASLGSFPASDPPAFGTGHA